MSSSTSTTVAYTIAVNSVDLVYYPIDMLLRAVIMVVLVLLRRRQPLRFRYFTPMLMASSRFFGDSQLIMYAATNIAQVYIAGPDWWNIALVSYLAVVLVFQCCGSASYAMLVFRYFALTNLSKI